MARLEAVDLHLQVIQPAVAPVVPTHSLDSRIRQGGWQERGSKPAVGQGWGYTRDRGGDVWLEPGGAGADGAAVGPAYRLCHAVFVLVEGVESGVCSAVYSDASEDEKEGVGDKGAWVLGEAEGGAEGSARRERGESGPSIDTRHTQRGQLVFSLSCSGDPPGPQGKHGKAVLRRKGAEGQRTRSPPRRVVGFGGCGGGAHFENKAWDAWSVMASAAATPTMCSVRVPQKDWSTSRPMSLLKMP